MAAEAAAQIPEDEGREAGALEDERRFEKLRSSRLYFVRLPKPAELSSTSEHDKQKDLLDDKLRAISSELQPLMAERSKNSALLAEAREALRELKAQIDDKQLILNPYQQEKRAINQDKATQRKTREEQRQAERKAREDQFRLEQGVKQKVRNDFSSQYGHLGVANEDEIDARLQTLEFTQQHESLTISEEKAVLKQIKQLQDSREAVRTYSQWAADDKAEREAKAAQAKKRREEKERQQHPQVKPQTDRTAGGERPEDAPAEDPQGREMEELKRVIDGLWEDFKMQREIRNRHQEIEDGLKVKIEQFFEKRDTLRKERDEIWSKIQAHRDSVRSSNKPFTENRAFSSRVRELVKQSKAADASQLCADQTSTMMAKYASDAAFRKEYNRLWDAALEYPRPAPSASDSHHNAAASVIAEALEAARRSVASKQAKAKEKENEAKLPEPKKPSTSRAEAPPAANGPSSAPVSRPTIIPGMETSDKPRHKPKKEKKVAKVAAVELPVVDDAPFVPPVSASERSATVQSAEELKLRERERQREAAAEAAQRKERRRLAQEKKRQKAQLRAETPAQALSNDALEEVAAPETPPVEEVNFKAGSLPQGLPAAVTEETGKLRGRAAKSGATKPGKSAPAPRPRPFAKKTLLGRVRLYGRQLYSAAEEHPVAAGLSSVAALALAFAPALYYLS